MITYHRGDIFAAQAEALVNPVNTLGVSGRGLAAVFRLRFPDNAWAYADACARKQVRTGKMFVFAVNREEVSPVRLIVNFPTKKDWRDPSRLSFIESGLVDLANVINMHRIRSIAIPAIGCGLGGLSWGVVKPLIVAQFDDNMSVNAMLFEPW